MPLNELKRKLVEDNMGLVGTVIKENVKDVNNIGIFTYKDIYQIGCLGLTKAVEHYKPGEEKFSTCAYICIRNEIFNALEYATVRRRREEIVDPDNALSLLLTQNPQSEFEETASELEKMLDAAKSRATGVTAKGIDAIRLMAQGYKCREIGELMGGVTANDVTAWISKARVFLKEDADITALKDAI
jgi:RNA polymerase sigma factor (sigma-70 family)